MRTRMPFVPLDRVSEHRVVIMGLFLPKAETKSHKYFFPHPQPGTDEAKKILA